MKKAKTMMRRGRKWKRMTEKEDKKLKLERKIEEPEDTE